MNILVLLVAAIPTLAGYIDDLVSCAVVPFLKGQINNVYILIYASNEIN